MERVPVRSRAVLVAVFFVTLFSLLGYHGVRDTVAGFDGPDWTFGFEIGHVARSLTLGEGFSYRIRGAHGTVPSVVLRPDLRRQFNDLTLAGQPEDATSLPVSWVSPVYALLLAGIFQSFGAFTPASAWAVLVMNSVFQALALLVFLTLARSLQKPWVAALSVGLFFLEPSGFEYSGHMWSQNLYILTLLWLFRVTLFPTVRLPDVGFGLAAALPPLVDSSAIPMVGLCFAFRAFQGQRSGFRRQVAAVATMLAVLTPWALRNGSAVGSYTPLKNTVGVVLRMGNSPNAAQFVYYNGFYANPFWNGDEMLRYARLGEDDYNRDAMGRALQFILDDPTRMAEAVRDRAVVFWLGRRALEWVRVDLDAKDFKDLGPLRGTERGHRIWRSVIFVLLPLGLVAGIRSRRTRPAFLLIAAVVTLFPLVYYFTIAIDRYRSPIDGLLCLTAAQAVAGVAALARRRGAVGDAGGDGV